MRLFAKIFLCGTIIFSLAFLISGYFLINYTFENSLTQELDFALKQYQYDKFTVQAGLIANADAAGAFIGNDEKEEMVFGGLANEIDNQAAFFSEDAQPLYSELSNANISFIQRLSEKEYVYQMFHDEMEGYILIGGRITQNNTKIYFVTQTDISGLLEQQETLIDYFQRIYCIALGMGMLLILIFSTFLTRPLKGMAKAANRIAGGDYNERMDISGMDEMSELAGSFNQMAEAVEEKVMELSNTARQKEDFVANFAHELKTPLTAMIGYADMLYQKELPREEIKKAAEHIWNEGMRLESLSFKLMDMTVLNRQEFPLQEVKADELVRDIADGLAPLMQDRGVRICLQIESAYIRVEYDLFKTLMINIIDNSVKAASENILITGKIEDMKYKICIKDDGQGIPKEDLSRITEAFYMVDKSRSRKQHGAGLGLALVMQIARIHGGSLEFESEEGKGTEVSLTLPCEEVSS